MTYEIKTIEGFPEYRIDNLGCVWAKRHWLKWKQLRPRANTNGYLRVTLYDANGKPFDHYIHRLVLAAFVGPCPIGCESCHGDGNKANNQLDNLRWDTKKNNSLDRRSHGTDHRGERHNMAKLTSEQVLEIRKKYIPKVVTTIMLAREYGLHKHHVRAIIKRRAWSHLPEENSSATPSLSNVDCRTARKGSCQN